MSEVNDVRAYALHQAVQFLGNPFPVGDEHGRATSDVLRVAARFERWLTRPSGATRIILSAGVVVDQATGKPTGTVIEGEDMAQLHDNEQFTLSAEPTDSKGQPVGDTLTWTIDNPQVATLEVSADTLSVTVVAGSVGSATITVTDGTLTATEALDVIAGPVAAIKLTEGPVEQQPAPAPAA